MKAANHESRLSSVEDRMEDADNTLAALWAFGIKVYEICEATQKVTRELVCRLDGVTADGLSEEAVRDLRQTQRVVVALAKKADLFNDEELAELFNETQR